MKKENTNLPLWKVLNEQRITHEIFDGADGGIGFTIQAGEYAGSYAFLNQNKTGLLFADIVEEQITPSLEYMALAYNNLHILAEALEKCREWFYLNGKGFKLPLDGSPGTPACFHSIEEALNHIS